jgi:hypothetical protein
MTWTQVEHLSQNDFLDYVQTLSPEEQKIEIKKFSKRMLKLEMKKNICFYSFIKNYSPRDFKIIHRLPFVSQRVICKHVKYWNETHPLNKIKTLRIFYY